MSDTMIMDALKAFLKPIIAEAMHEAGNIADTATPSESFTEPTASVQESEEDLLPEETSKGSYSRRGSPADALQVLHR